MKRILALTLLAAFAALPAAPADAHKRAKNRWATVKPVRADVEAYSGMRGRAHLTANKRNAKVNLHLKGMVPGATYPWALVKGSDAETVCADGTAVENFKYRTLKARKKGNANSKGWAKKGTFTFDKTAVYAVVVYQAGTTDEVLLCGVFDRKTKKPKKAHKGKGKPRPVHAPKPGKQDTPRAKPKDG